MGTSPTKVHLSVFNFLSYTYSNNPIARLYPPITEGWFPHQSSDVMPQGAVVFLPERKAQRTVHFGHYYIELLKINVF